MSSLDTLSAVHFILVKTRRPAFFEEFPKRKIRTRGRCLLGATMRISFIVMFAVAGSLFVPTANAADIPVKAGRAPASSAFNWSGCYAGAYVGGAWAAQSATATDLDGYNAAGDSWSYRPNGSVIGGGTLGCNYTVSPAWVVGIEGEAGYLHVKGSAVDPASPFIPLDTEALTRIGDWYGVVAGRVGYTWDSWMLYGKVGVAISNVAYGVSDTNPIGGNTINTRKSSTQAALAVGAGLEYALAKSWTVKAEYLYMDFTASDNTCGAATIGGGTFCWSNDFRGVHMAKIGINYLFGR
jgi:outer membrane immunogenic protein